MLPIDLQILKYIFIEKPIYYYKIRPFLTTETHQKITDQIHSMPSPNIHQSKLSELDYTIFDLETTGFIPEIGHEIISVGAIRLNGLDACHRKTFYSVVQPLRPVGKQTLNLTGLTRTQLAEAPLFMDAFQDFFDFCQGSVLVAHPAKFDMRFLQTMLKRWKLPALNVPVIDSQVMARHLFPEVKHQLDPLLKRFNIDKRERHHALNDAVMTAELFSHLLQLIIKENVQTFGELKNTLEPHKKARSH
ncbi:3'-5' exonuclease [Halobacillus sp. A1]|uniref:3'-5' exonuclease n=1 Tax=Halobacillus sp. A1 TaxID=2880262 RepID=UPI0020A66D0C|nr:3'-5' exonuclease [Halobacillus sp. A1]MCP3032959.1 3'-5' exonuclease [Halobacillus sp. A1]